jgi:hypothetical protein
MGSGRSGTSLMTGLLASNAYFMGENLYPPRKANPTGFFESFDINHFNELLLKQVCPKRPPILGKFLFKNRPTDMQRWLAILEPNTVIKVKKNHLKILNDFIKHQPFCFKDPRFSYTFPFIQQYFPKDTIKIVVFRHPVSTINSILTELKEAAYLSNLDYSEEMVTQVWKSVYSFILNNNTFDDSWIFVHYEHLINKINLHLIEEKLSISLNTDIIDDKYYRNNHAPTENIPPDLQSIYIDLCQKSNFQL